MFYVLSSHSVVGQKAVRLPCSNHDIVIDRCPRYNTPGRLVLVRTISMGPGQPPDRRSQGQQCVFRTHDEHDGMFERWDRTLRGLESRHLRSTHSSHIHEQSTGGTSHDGSHIKRHAIGRCCSCWENDKTCHRITLLLEGISMDRRGRYRRQSVALAASLSTEAPEPQCQRLSRGTYGHGGERR